MKMSSKQIIDRYFEFFQERNHEVIPNVSLIPENDPTLLFVNSGMFPLVPYLMGEPHPMGSRLVNVQRCIRFEDIEEVGDSSHTTAFHMLGNWSLNDYFKEEQLNWIYEFLFEVLKISPQKTYPTVFAGNESAPRDDESLEILRNIFDKYGASEGFDNRVCFFEDNWWQRGDAVGELGGPDSEIFYYLGEGNPGNKTPQTHESEFLEIGNSVFMQYIKAPEGWVLLDSKNVDFGGGLERIAQVCQGKSDIFETGSFWPLIEKIQSLSVLSYGESPEITRNMRILADHIRSGVFLAMDGVTPSNKDQGYLLRRFIRRMVRCGKSLGIEKGISADLVGVTVEVFEWLYPDLRQLKPSIEKMFKSEEDKFRRTLTKASKQVDKYLDSVSTAPTEEALAKQAFVFYQSLGYPDEIFMEDLRARGIAYNRDDFLSKFEALVEEHKEKSRRGAEGKFKGGLADLEEQTLKYHTATHLLHEALRRVLGKEVVQKGSNITGERLRFDFSFSRKLDPIEFSQVEEIINQVIRSDLPVKFEIMEKEQAFSTDALHFFGEKYGDKVKVYYVGNSLEEAFSKEFCGGPHVASTGELEPLVLYKQEKIGRRAVRIYGRFESTVS